MIAGVARYGYTLHDALADLIDDSLDAAARVTWRCALFAMTGRCSGSSLLTTVAGWTRSTSEPPCNSASSSVMVARIWVSTVSV